MMRDNRNPGFLAVSFHRFAALRRAEKNGGLGSSRVEDDTSLTACESGFFRGPHALHPTGDSFNAGLAVLT
jgi:hypothetical protein